MSATSAFIPAAIGPYAIERVLGRGAMSVVYQAHSPQFGAVALKLLRAELLAGPERAATLVRFRREAEVGMRLNHPNIVRVYGHGEADGAPYLAMELAPGRELRDYLADGEAGPLTLPAAVSVLRQVLAALGCAHRLGVVHRDVKPANIVLGPDGVPKLTDFGVAREADSDVTQVGELLGTPAFIAPELLAGQNATAAADQFSAGVVAYYLLTGQRPFSGTVATVMQQILFKDPVLPSFVNPALTAAFDGPLLRALAKRPEARHPSVDAFAQSLADALAAAGDRARIGAFSAGVGIVDAAVDATPSIASARPPLETLIDYLRAAADAPVTERQLDRIARAVQAATGSPRDRLLHVLEFDGLKPAAARLLASAPAPGAAPSRADFMLNARLLSTLAAALERLGEGRRAIPHLHGAAGRLTDVFLDAAQRLTAALEADDNPDVMRLSADFLRLDVLAMALEELGAKHELTEASTAMAALTTLVMGKINSLLNACIHDNDGFARFGVSVMLNDVEDLIDIARRALEGGLIGGASADLTGRGAAQVAEFIRLAAQFADLSLEELRGGLDEQSSGMTAAAFAAKLRPIGALYRFAARLPAEAAKDELAALTRLLHRRVAAMVLTLADTDPAGPGRGERLAALFDLADGLGWREVAAAALRLLRG